MSDISRITGRKSKSRRVVVSPEQADRRIDNFLLSLLKPIPKSRIYQMLRRGEVRVGGARIKPDYRLKPGDSIRIPPLFEQPVSPPDKPPDALLAMLENRILHEDERLMAVNKPAGLVVHAGSGSVFGVIELLRVLYPQKPDLQLIHRLDKETSGCLLLANNMAVLRQLNLALKNGEVQKEYHALLRGRLSGKRIPVDSPLQRSRGARAEGRVRVDKMGKPARSDFEIIRVYRDATHVRVRTATGRTHQIRVHAASIGHPLAGDKKYGDREFNKKMRRAGLRRMFLHAAGLSVPELKKTGKYRFSAPLPAELQALLSRIE